MKRKAAETLFFAICAVQGIWTLVSIWTLPNSGGEGIILGLNPLRLVMMALVIFLMGVFIALAGSEWRVQDEGRSNINRLLSTPGQITGAFLLLITLWIVLYLAAYSPMRVNQLHSYFSRANALVIWGVLIVLQFFILVLLLRGPRYFLEGWMSLVYHDTARKMYRFIRSPLAGYALLLLAFLVGLTRLYYGRFVDEADNLTVGWLVSQGSVLYQDVFSHHFPFPYYWVAGVVSLAGNSFVAVRVSLMLLQLGLLAVSMKITRLYLVIGLTSLVWNLISHFHRGQEAVYATFESLFMLAAFIIIFNLLVNRAAIGVFTLLWIGLLLALSLLTDPLMIYPVAIALMGLFVSGFRRRIAKPAQEGFRRLLGAGIVFAVLVGVFAVYLFASGSAGDFYQQAIWFNQEIYAKYEDARALRFDTILQNAATGLDIFNPRWVRHTSPFIPLETYRSVKLEDENLYSTWVFSGFLFRLSILACMAGLLMGRKFIAAIFLYLFAAAMLVRASDGFYAMGFTLVSLFAACYLLAELNRPAIFRAARMRQAGVLSRGWLVARAAWWVLLVCIAGMHIWSVFRGGYYLVKNWHWITSPRHVTMYEEFGDEIRQLACGQEGLELSVFPINPIVNFVTGIPPASKYVYMYPWVAEIGKDELIAELKANPSAIVWINTGRKSGEPDAPAVYMADVIDFLNREYFVLVQDIWLSPELAKRCDITPDTSPIEISE